MTRGLVRSIAITTVALALGFAPAAQADDEQDVGRAEAEWARALVAADLPALETIYSDDLMYVHSSGSIDTKQTFLESIRSGRLRFKSITARDARVRVRHYGTVGVVNALYDLVLELRGGNVTPMTIQYLTVYVKDGSRWRIVTQQTTRLPAPAGNR
jgi:ketosteroid isomerase-like protein